MSIYSEYIGNPLPWITLNEKRKEQLKRISEYRGGRDILVFASALTKDAPVAIDYDDRVPFFDQLDQVKSDKLDIILETPGGYAEVVEDFIRAIRNRFSEVAMIIPGCAKSAGTIMAMAGDEILMQPTSTLGPIDAQINQRGKRFSAHAFLTGLEKIKEEVEKTGMLNKAYIPILQNISPGEIQNFENAQNLSRLLVSEWLSNYKFKFWNIHSSTGKEVTPEEKRQRADEIAGDLGDHGRWLTHGRSITINDLRELRLQVTDYSENPELYDAIQRYYNLLKISFDTTSIYKIYETLNSQIYRFVLQSVQQQTNPIDSGTVNIEIECPNCKTKTNLQVNLDKDKEILEGMKPFPKDDNFICPKCNSNLNVGGLRRQIELQTKKKII